MCVRFFIRILYNYNIINYHGSESFTESIIKGIKMQR